MGQNEGRGTRAHHAVVLVGAFGRARRGLGTLVLTGSCLLTAVVLAGCSAGPVSPPEPLPGPQAPHAAAAGASSPTAEVSAGGSSPTTVVSLTFDDGNWTQYAIFPKLLDYGMRATFYVNTGLVDRGDPTVMTWDQLRHLSSAGNDIGGHTRDHAHLTQLSTADQQAQVCGDRDRLVAEGFNPVSFAYPYGEHDAATEALVRSCGYRTGRTTGGLDGTHHAATIPPGDPYALASLTGGTESGTNPPLQLDMLESAVTAAAKHGGGWVPVVLHTVCQRSEPYYQACMSSDGPIDYEVLSSFLDWLQYQAPAGTVVEPVSEVSALP